MRHFESIWNEAESVAKSFSDLDRKDIFVQIRSATDDLVDSDSIAGYNEALGNVLFGLCSLCAYLEEKKNIELNSAAALTQAISNKRTELLSKMR